MDFFDELELVASCPGSWQYQSNSEFPPSNQPLAERLKRKWKKTGRVGARRGDASLISPNSLSSHGSSLSISLLGKKVVLSICDDDLLS